MLDHSKFRDITTFIFDVDGVFTNSEVIVMENGDLVRTMSTRDGQAIKYALEAGYNIAIITKGFSSGVRKRFELLGIQYIFDRLPDKAETYALFKKTLNLTDSEILYMGDDVPDLVILHQAGIAACPYDAVPEVIEASDFIAAKDGGRGCVREVIERVMKIQGKWLA